MNVLSNQSEADYLLQTVDPYNKQKMTFSEIVNLLSNHMVAKTEDAPHVTVPLLEKFANIETGEFEPDSGDELRTRQVDQEYAEE